MYMKPENEKSTPRHNMVRAQTRRDVHVREKGLITHKGAAVTPSADFCEQHRSGIWLGLFDVLGGNTCQPRTARPATLFFVKKMEADIQRYIKYKIVYQ